MATAESANLRSPLSQARGLGSAKDGVHHFIAQRVTAIALVPLTVWFVISVVRLPVADYGWVHHWVSAPSVAIALSIFIALLMYHAALGVQTVIEDYVAGHGAKLVWLLTVKAVLLIAAVTGIFSVLRIAFGY